MRLWPQDPISSRFYRRWGLWSLAAFSAFFFFAAGLPITGTTLTVAVLVALPFVVRLGARDIAEQKRLADEKREKGFLKLASYMDRLREQNPQAYAKGLDAAYGIAENEPELMRFLQERYPRGA